MAGRKKIIKKKLKKPDEFISLTQEVLLFTKQHFKNILSGGLIVLIIFLSLSFYKRWERGKEEEANQRLNSALEVYQVVSSPYQEASPPNYKDILEKFKEIGKKYPRTLSGKLSFLYIGDIHLRIGEFEESIKAYQTFLQKGGSEKLYRIFALEGMGHAYGGKKDYKEAIHAYQKILDLGDSFQLANTYLSLGYCYEKLGKSKEALENYKDFLKSSPKSYMTNVILRKISQLDPR